MLLRKLTATTLLGALGCALLGLLAGLLLAPSPAQPATHSTDKTVIAAGDISCQATEAKTTFTCRADDTAALTQSLKPNAVLTLGDNQYPIGALTAFRNSYDKTWGSLTSITHPVPGNHEYLTPNASGYFDYFGAQAGERGRGYYGFSVGAWRFIALNSEISVGENSAQLLWLKQELQQHKSACTLAYWHRPRFSSGGHAGESTYDALWRLLYAEGVDVVVNGHSHAYERFLPQNPDAQYDPAKGITQFVSGMGGRSVEPLNDPLPLLATRQNHAFGVLKFSLYPKGAHYQFVSVPGQQIFTDSGSIACH